MMGGMKRGGGGLRAAGAAAEVLNGLDAERIPRHVAAESIRLADATRDLIVLAACGVVRHAAVFPSIPVDQSHRSSMRGGEKEERKRP